jgi:type IV pilus assembly protein PilB
MHIKEEKLKGILEESGVVDATVFEEAKNEASRAGQTVTNVLIGRDDIPEYYLIELIQKYFNLPSVDLKTVTIPQDVLHLIPENYAKSESIVSFENDDRRKVLKVAMRDPVNLKVIEFLRSKLNIWIEPYITSGESLQYGLKQYKREIGADFNKIISENIDKAVSVSGEMDISKLAEDVPIITILDSIVENAIQLGASDIHFEPFPKQLVVRYRVDGILHEILTMPKVIDPIVVARVKILGNLQIDEHRIPQDGRFSFEAAGAGVDVRVSVMPVLNGEKVVMRLLRGSNKPLSLEEIGLSQYHVEIVMREISKPHGMILVTGPTGHGKTTTLYAILHILNTTKVNITSIEDPIEYEVQRVNQTQVNLKAGVTFSNGLRALLRQNPDIIMIGEIRDNETVEIAVHAALTGHLVLSSLHTNDAPSALPRLIDMGAPPFLLASTINLIIAQRLVRKICNNCIESYGITPEVEKVISDQIVVSNDKHIKGIPKILYRGKGCKVCSHSGFRGQIGIFEICEVSESLKALVLQSASAADIRSLAIKEGMATMFGDGLVKVERGITTIEELLRVVRE